VEEAFWRTIIADTSPSVRPAPEAYVRHWEEVFCKYDNLRSKNPRIPADHEEIANIYRILQYTSSEDMRFTHLLAIDISKKSRNRGGNVSSVLNRIFDITCMHDPRVSQGRQFCHGKRVHGAGFSIYGEGRLYGNIAWSEDTAYSSSTLLVRG
jgi:hypothetical protein